MDDLVPYGLGVLGRSFGLTGIVVLTGTVADRVLGDRAGGAVPHNTLLSWFALIVLIVGLACELAGQSVSAFGMGQGWRPSSLQVIAFDSRWGEPWTRRVVAAVFAVVAVGMARRNRLAAPIAVGVVILTTAWSGHALVVSGSIILPVVLQTIHLLSAGLWLGLLLATTIRFHRSDQAEWLGGIAGFSNVAKIAAPTVLATGVVAVLVYLDELSVLWTSTWGVTLLIKVALVSVPVVLGFLNWKSVTPAVQRGTTSLRTLRWMIYAELVIGWTVILASAVLMSQSFEP